MSEGVLKNGRAVFLLSALIYTLAVAVIIVLVVRVDPFTMFHPPYWMMCFVVLPIVWLFVTVRVAFWYGSLPKLWLVFHLVVLGLVTFVHFWLMVQFAASI